MPYTSPARTVDEVEQPCSFHFEGGNLRCLIPIRYTDDSEAPSEDLDVTAELTAQEKTDLDAILAKLSAAAYGKNHTGP